MQQLYSDLAQEYLRLSLVHLPTDAQCDRLIELLKIADFVPPLATAIETIDWIVCDYFCEVEAEDAEEFCTALSGLIEEHFHLNTSI